MCAQGNVMFIIVNVATPCFPTLTDPDNGVINCCGDQATAQNCSFSCAPGYELIGTQTLTCLTSGVWSADTPTCQPRQCPQPPFPDNGFVQLPCSGVYNTSCAVGCFDGYRLNGSDTISCELRDGTDMVVWTTSGACEGQLVSSSLTF